jgi:hypothetical protein
LRSRSVEARLRRARCASVRCVQDCKAVPGPAGPADLGHDLGVLVGQVKPAQAGTLRRSSASAFSPISSRIAFERPGYRPPHVPAGPGSSQSGL